MGMLHIGRTVPGDARLDVDIVEYASLDQITGMGFLTREANGYRAVEGMKVNVVEE